MLQTVSSAPTLVTNKIMLSYPGILGVYNYSFDLLTMFNFFFGFSVLSVETCASCIMVILCSIRRLVINGVC